MNVEEEILGLERALKGDFSQDNLRYKLLINAYADCQNPINIEISDMARSVVLQTVCTLDQIPSKVKKDDLWEKIKDKNILMVSKSDFRPEYNEDLHYHITFC